MTDSVAAFVVKKRVSRQHSPPTKGPMDGALGGKHLAEYLPSSNKKPKKKKIYKTEMPVVQAQEGNPPASDDLNAASQHGSASPQTHKDAKEGMAGELSFSGKQLSIVDYNVMNTIATYS